jgi:hypothetical protein
MGLARQLEEATGGLESGLDDPRWLSREFGVADISGSTAQERAADLAYQLGWEEGKSGRQHGGVKDLLALAKKRRWTDVSQSYESGKQDGSS